MGVGSQHHAPAALLPEKKTRYPFYRRLGRSQGRSTSRENLTPSPGFDPRTVQPVASRYTDWAILAHSALMVYMQKRNRRMDMTKVTCNFREYVNTPYKCYATAHLVSILSNQ